MIACDVSPVAIFINQAVKIGFWWKHRYSFINNDPRAVADLYNKGSTFGGVWQINSAGCISNFTPCLSLENGHFDQTLEVWNVKRSSVSKGSDMQWDVSEFVFFTLGNPQAMKIY